MRRQTKRITADDEDWDDENTYFTYRPLSNLPTPPPSSRQSSAAQSPKPSLEDGEQLNAKYRGPAIHLVNLIPSSCSLAIASISLVQAILSRAALPLETVALAVCILDSLDAKFARTWRLSCPLQSGSNRPGGVLSKRHTLPPTPLLHHEAPQLHIDSVSPEIVVLSALVIAAKFTEDSHESSDYYCSSWGRGTWSTAQLNATERCIMARLGYRILPLCDELYIADAMVDMQLAGRQHDWRARQPTPPELLTPTGVDEGHVLCHNRSKTMAAVGLGSLSELFVASAAAVSPTQSAE